MIYTVLIIGGARSEREKMDWKVRLITAQKKMPLEDLAMPGYLGMASTRAANYGNYPMP